MKTIKTLSILFLSLVTFFACNDDSLNVDNPDGNIVEGGLLDVKNTSINYVVGNPGPYSASMRVYQGAVKTTSIRVAKTFYSGSFVSNTVQDFKTIAISDTNQNSFASFSFTFPEAIQGLNGANGSPLSSNDGDYQIGDYWKFDYYVTTSEGEHLNYASTKATISTRYAGTYKVIESAYWNSGGLQSGNWNGDEVVIESIDASIYKHNGLAYWADNTYYFTVNSATGDITILGQDLNGADVLLNTSPIMVCGGSYTFESLTCKNKATPNDVTGEDVLEFTTGYFRGAGATREFYEKMVKLVD